MRREGGEGQEREVKGRGVGGEAERSLISKTCPGEPKRSPARDLASLYFF